MPREVNSSNPFADRLFKLVPTEIVATYTALSGVVGLDPTPNAPAPDKLTKTLIQVTFLILLALTPIYLRKVGNVSSKRQLCLSSISFVVWVYTLGGPFIAWGIFHPKVAAVTLILWTLVMPLLVETAITSASPNDNHKELVTPAEPNRVRP